MLRNSRNAGYKSIQRNQRIRDLKIRIEFITAIMLRIKLWAAMRIEKQEFVTLQHI